MILERTVILQKDISVLEIVPDASDARLGQLVALPKGARLEICGSGFNHRSVKAHYEGRFFFVYLLDIDSPSTGAFGAATS
jgi:hypothetical protein